VMVACLCCCMFHIMYKCYDLAYDTGNCLLTGKSSSAFLYHKLNVDKNCTSLKWAELFKLKAANK